MKPIGFYHDMPIYLISDLPLNIIFCEREDMFELKFPRRKDGKPDMRYGINRLMRALEEDNG